MTGRGIAGLVVAITLLHLALALPARPSDVTPGAFLRLPLELPVAIALLCLWPRRPLRLALILATATLLVLRLADLGTFQAFSRPFNPALDLHLLVSGWTLLSASVGWSRAAAAVGLAGLGVAAFVGVLSWSLHAVAELGRGQRSLVLGCAAGILITGAALMPHPRVTAGAVPETTQRVARMADAAADLRRFSATLATDDVGEPDFAAIGDRDVILLFVESYGRSFLTDPAYADVAGPRIRAIEARLAGAGWTMRSAWVTAPTRGGQSWLSHGTLLSGLWTDNQARYDRLIASERRSLNDLFGAAGWHTGAAMPAITLDWPESAWFGYDVLLDASGMGYRGAPFEWVTMPDQFTLRQIERRLRGPGPDMIEAALITSHAPWTPLPRILDWGAIGDGAIFDGTRRDGASPREVWSDPARIRAAYAASLDYALEVIAQYIARFGEDALFVVVGDHQPAQLLTGPRAGADVPLHVVAADPALLAPLPGAFSAGLVPPEDAPSLRMDRLRAIFATIWERPGQGPGTTSPQPTPAKDGT